MNRMNKCQSREHLPIVVVPNLFNIDDARRRRLLEELIRKRRQPHMANCVAVASHSLDVSLANRDSPGVRP